MSEIRQNRGEENQTIKTRKEQSDIKGHNGERSISSKTSSDRNIRGLDDKEFGKLMSGKKNGTMPIVGIVDSQDKKRGSKNKAISSGASSLRSAAQQLQAEAKKFVKDNGEKIKDSATSQFASEPTAEQETIDEFNSYAIAGTTRAFHKASKTTPQTKKAIKKYQKTTKLVKEKTVAKNALKTKKQVARESVRKFRDTQKVVRDARMASATTRKEAAKASAKTTKETVKYTVKITREVVKSVVAVIKATVKLAIEATEALIATIGVFGCIIIVVLLVVVGGVALIASPYGVLFTDDSGGYTIQEAMTTIDSEFSDDLKKIEKENKHDKEVLSNYACQYSIANWSDIIAVWDINLNLGDKQEEVVTIDDDKLDELRSVVDDMVTISHHTDEEVTDTFVYDSNGVQLFNPDGTPFVVKNVITTLVIEVEYKSADDMSSQYSFSKEQHSTMLELLSSDDYIALFNTGGVNIDFSTLNFDDENVNDIQKNLIAVAVNASRYGITAENGMCQNWVSRVYQVALKQERKSAANATEAGKKWGVSSDWSKIQVGACVYGYSSSAAGHVGIYIGNGKVIHNLSGSVKVDTLEKWVKTYDGFVWGWNGADNLTGDSKWNVK